MTTSETLPPGAAGAFFDVPALMASFPATAGPMLLDIRLSDEPAASSRIFRVYRPVPPHYHAACDEYLYLLSGCASFVLADQAPRELCAGQMVFFRRGTVHAIVPLEDPVLFLTVDTPRRDPDDVHFVDPDPGTAKTFIATIGGTVSRA